MRPSYRNAFSLVELLVVIAIISVLAAMLLPTLHHAMESGRRVACLNGERQLVLHTFQFAEEHRDELPRWVKGWSSGNRTMDKDVFDPYRSLEYFWYGGATMAPFGLLATKGYVQTPSLFFCPSLNRDTFGDSVRVFWDQPKYATTWKQATDGDNNSPSYWMSCGYANLTQAMNYNNPSTNFFEKAVDNVTLRFVERHWRDSFSADTVTRRMHVSPFLYACFNQDSWYGKPGPFVSHGFEGVNAAAFDGSARWVGWDETGSALYSGQAYLSGNFFIGWARTKGAPGRK